MPKRFFFGITNGLADQPKVAQILLPNFINSSFNKNCSFISLLLEIGRG